MFEAVARELRAKLVGAEKHIRNSGPVSRADSSPHSVPQAPPHALSCTDDEATANTSRSSPTVPTSRSRCRYAEGADLAVAPRVSHQHSASSPNKLLNMSLVGVARARVARAVFPCDDTYCRSPTLRQRQGQLRNPWDFDPADNWEHNECAPPVSRGRTRPHASSMPRVRRQPFHWPLSRSSTTSSQSSDRRYTSRQSPCSGNTRNHHPSANRSPSHHWTSGSTR